MLADFLSNPSSPMQPTKAPAFRSSALSIPSDRDLEALKRAIRQWASDTGLSNRSAERYEAWILVFISWWMRTTPYSVSHDRIEEVRLAVVQHSSSEQRDVNEAMDAPAFFWRDQRDQRGSIFNRRLPDK